MFKFFYFYRYCVPESPRWLLATGRLDELFAIVERAARMNGTTLPTNYKKSLEAVVPRQNSIETVEEAKLAKNDINPITTTTATQTTIDQTDRGDNQ